jgi:hypothetical protein
MKPIGTAGLALLVPLAVPFPLAAQTTGKAWSERWKAENKQWVACHIRTARAAKAKMWADCPLRFVVVS